MRYITEIELTCRFFKGQGASQFVYHINSGTLPLSWMKHTRRYSKCALTMTRVEGFLSEYSSRSAGEAAVSTCSRLISLRRCLTT